MKEPFILTSWVKMCLDAFAREGALLSGLLTLANVPATCLDRPLLSVAHANALFQAAEETLGDGGIGINAGRNISPTTFYALGYAAIASKNLLEGFRLIAQYSYGITDITELFLIEEKERVGFGFYRAPAGMHFHPVGSDAAMSMVLRICRLLQQGPAQILEVTMARPSPKNTQAYRRYFKAPVVWESPAFCLYFSRAYFERPNMHADPELAKASAQMAAHYFSGLFSNQGYTHLVRREINQALAQQNLGLADIARKLNLSERSLQRQLNEEGTSFRELQEQLKKEAAQRYVTTTAMSISQIAYTLGFNDAGNFSRAFKRWFGDSPLGYRKRCLSGLPGRLSYRESGAIKPSE